MYNKYQKEEQFVSDKKQYELDFEEYIKNSEPDKKDKTYAWTTAIGLQQVDKLTKNSWYFRNALVRANYNNLQKGIRENPEYLEKFFRNLLLNEHNELKNRYLHIRYKKENVKKVGTLNGTLKNKLINIIKEQQSVKQNDIAMKLNVSLRTVKRVMKTLVDDKILERVGSKKTGYWKVLIQ